MQMLATIELRHGIVITQSCDALRVDRIMVAPLLPYDKEGKSPKEQWSYINNLATSLHETTRMYLPDDESRGLQRQIIDLGGIFTLPRDEMDLFIRQGRRVTALDGEGLRYLQFRLAVMFWRVARDDYYWPSDKDIALKVSMFDGDMNKLEKDLQNRVGERRKVADHLDQAISENSRAKFQQSAERIDEQIGDIRANLEEKRLERQEAQEALAGRQGAAQQSPFVLAAQEVPPPAVEAYQQEMQQSPGSSGGARSGTGDSPGVIWVEMGFAAILSQAVEFSHEAPASRLNLFPYT